MVNIHARLKLVSLVDVKLWRSFCFYFYIFLFIFYDQLKPQLHFNYRVN